MDQNQVPIPPFPPQKGNDPSKIIIFVIIILALVIGGYFTYKYFSASNNSRVNTPGISKNNNSLSTSSVATPSASDKGVVEAILDSKQKAAENKVRADLMQLRTAAEIYYEADRSYVGFTGQEEINQDIKTSGSEVNIQGLTESTFVLSAILPYSKTVYCVDTTGFAGSVSNISPTQTTCQ